MVDWDIIACGFNTADETLNFGTRNFASGDILYESCTLASLRCNQPKSSNIYFKALIIENGVFLSIDSTIKVFTDTNCCELYLSLNFDEIITTFCVTRNRRYLLICLRNGIIHCMDIANENKIIFSKVVIDGDAEEVLLINCFEECVSNHMSILVVVNEGKIFRISFESEVDYSNEENAKKLALDLIVDLNCGIKCASFNNSTVLTDGEMMCLYNISNGDTEICDGLNLKEIYSCDNNMFIGIDVQGNLIQVCSRTLLTLSVNAGDGLFESFIFVSNSSDCSQIVALTKPDQLGLSYIQEFTYPEMKCQFNMKVKESSHLILSENTHDEPMYVSVLKADGLIEELRILQIVDTFPENRLRRLLHRNKLEDAFRFAELYNLSTAEIKKEKAKRITENLTYKKEDIQELFSILDSIEHEVCFKVGCCIDVFRYCEDLTDVNEVLKYGCTCLTNSDTTKNSEQMYELMKIISDMKNRFEIFVLIQRQCKYVGTWEEFTDCNLLDLVCVSLQKHNIEQAIIIYNRLDFMHLLKLYKERIHVILPLLSNLSLNSCTSFLYSFLPIAILHEPNILTLFVEWLKEKLFSIELTYAKAFPKTAIDFINIFLQIVNVENLTNHSSKQLELSTLNEFANIMKSLKTLDFLKETYSIVLSLKEYLKGARSLISTLLFVQINDKIYEEFLSNFLCNFILEHSFQPDTIFFEEICNIIKYQERYWIKIVPSILKCINAVDVKLNATIILLKNTEVPWCSTIRDIAKSSLKYESKLVDIIKDYIRNEPKHIVLRNPVYKFPRDVDISSDLQYIIGRIIYCNEPTIVEDAFQMATNREDFQWIALRLTDSFVRSRNISLLLKVFTMCTSNQIADICRSVVTIIECYDDFKILQETVQNYSPMLKLTHKLWIENSINYNKMGIEESFDGCRNYFKVKEKYYPNVRLSELKNLSQKQEILDKIINDITQQYLQQVLRAKEVLNCCAEISELLNEPKAIVRLCQKVNEFDCFVKLISAVNVDVYSAETLCIIAVLILKNISLSTSENAAKNIDTYSLAFKLAQQFTISATLKSGRDNMSSCIEVYNWSMVTFFSHYSNLHLEVFPKKNGNGVTPSFINFEPLRISFTAFTRFKGTHENPNMKYCTFFEDQVNHLNEEQFINIISQLPLTLKNICIEGHCLTACKLIVILKSALLNFNHINIRIYEALHNILINCCIPQVLQKVLSARNIDTDCAYMLLVSYKRKDIFKEIKNHLVRNKRYVQKLRDITKLALRVANYHEIDTSKSGYDRIILLSKWWEKISNCQLSVKEFFSFSNDKLLEKLIENQHLSFHMLEEFSKDFNLNLQTSYNIYLKKLLTNWIPDYSKIVDEFGESKILFKKDEEQLFEACKEVVEVMDDKDHLDTYLNNLYSDINFYHYEVFICIFKLLQILNKKTEYSKKLMLLMFLKTYKRIRTPSNTEIEKWFSAFPHSQNIDPLSQWRLPFTHTLFTNDIWKIIRPELNLKTYNIWFDAVQILEETLNTNDICIYVVKEVVSSGVLKMKETESWSFYSPHENLFKEIDVCIGNITDYEKATSVVYYLLNQTPQGINQVHAAKLCLKYAIQYKEHCSHSDSSVLDAFKKIKFMYLCILGRHILQKYKLAYDEYIKLLPNLNELINALYSDKSLLDIDRKFTFDCPDINKAVDELGNLFEIDVQEQRLRLLESYLSDEGASYFSLNTTLWSIKPFDVNDSCEFSGIYNIKRAAYICQSDDVQYWRNYLTEKGLNENKNFSYRANALKCLCAISDPSTIEELTSIPNSEFVKYVEKLYLLSDLECLGSLFDIEQIDSLKFELLKSLSQDIFNPISIKTMTAICIIYEIHNLEYWKKIISSSIKLKLYQNLKNCLIFLKTLNNAEYTKIYTDAWQAIIDHAFNISCPKENVYDVCVENILLLQSCPVLFTLNLKNAVKFCIELQMLEFSAIILQYLNEKDRLEYAKTILSVNNKKLLSNIKKLSLRGIWGTSYVIDLLCSLMIP